MGQGRGRATELNPEPLEDMPDYDISADTLKANLKKGSVSFAKQTKRKPNLNKVFYKTTNFYDPKDLPTTAKMTTRMVHDSSGNNSTKHTKPSQFSSGKSRNSAKSAYPATVWYRDWESIEVPTFEKLAHHKRTDRSYVSIKH